MGKSLQPNYSHIRHFSQKSSVDTKKVYKLPEVSVLCLFCYSGSTGMKSPLEAKWSIFNQPSNEAQGDQESKNYLGIKAGLLFLRVKIKS